MSINSDNSKVKKNNVRIIMTFGKHKIEIKMHDNPSSRDFLNQLPMTLKFSDYEGTEKIANLKKKLSTAGSYSGFDPSIGDVTYYAPWGNIAIFYKDFGYAKGLIPLGVIECGLNDLSHLTKNIIVHVSKIENK
ncbi:MAG: hypothetical protein JXR95_02000 [Deltaproteobacteria bacterium]|nr:hypothetical protein [Deltaproteobacteria bacterium]